MEGALEGAVNALKGFMDMLSCRDMLVGSRLMVAVGVSFYLVSVRSLASRLIEADNI